MSATESKNRADNKVEAAQLLKLPVFFFNTEAVRECLNDEFESNPADLVALCQEQLQCISPRDVAFSAPSGIYLIVRSATGADADDIARRLGTAILSLAFRLEVRESHRERLFMQVPAREERTAPDLGEPASRDAQDVSRQDDPPGSASAQARDRFSDLAIRGALPVQNIELLFKPVHDLVRGRSTTLLCTPAFCVAHSPVITGYRAFEGISPEQSPLLDRAILAHALKFARRLGQAGVYVAAGASVSFQTLATAQGRATYCEALRAAGVPDYPFVVLAIQDVPLGATASKLAEVIGSLRALAKRIVVQLPGVDTALMSSGHLNADGFILSLPSRQRPTQIAAADWLARMCESQSALSWIDQVDDDGSLEIVRAASIRFGQGLALDSAEFRGDAAPIDVEAFMRNAARTAKSASREARRLGLHNTARPPAHRLN